MATFVVAHGAWSAGWAWKKMHPRLHALGHELVTPTYTGVGERVHLFSPAVDLETHIQDIINVLEFEDLRDVVLVGHSYGGMVATGVADRARERVGRLVYVDAFVPQDGQSVFGLAGETERERMRAAAQAAGDGLRIPPNPMPPDTAEADLAWAMPRRLPQPFNTFAQPLTLTGKPLTLPRSYIYCTRIPPVDVFGPFAARARSESGWRCFEIDSSHNPHITAPDALCALLQETLA